MLEDITLTMIVRDEIINPAGGLLPMLEHHLPYFPEAVVVDTGSVDGTRELLEYLADKHKQLRVYDHEFAGYADARNRANGEVRTKWSFVLDADERVTKKSLKKVQPFLGRELDDPKISSYRLRIKTVFPSDVRPYSTPLWTKRIFKSDLAFFEGLLYESISLDLGYYEPSDIIFYHFMPKAKNGFKGKGKFWYGKIGYYIKSGTAPSEHREFRKWKEPDPRVLKKFGIDLDGSIRKLRDLGIPLPFTIK